MIRYGLLFLIIVFYPYSLCAQQLTVQPSQYELEPLKIETTEDFGYFNDAIEDREGYLWLSSTRGLQVFDGKDLVRYQSKNKAATNPTQGTDVDNFMEMTLGQNGEIFVQDGTAGNLVSFDAINRKELPPVITNAPDKIVDFISVSPDSNVCLLLLNKKRTTFSIQRQTGINTFTETYAEKEEVTAPCYFHYACGYNWLIKGNRIIKFSTLGKKLREYKFEQQAIDVQSVYFNDLTFYLLDLAGEHLYYYDAANDKIELFFKLPSPLGQKAFWLLASGNTIFIANDISLVIIDRKNNTIEDASSTYVSDIKKNEPNGIGLGLAKLLRTHDGEIFILRQKSIYRLRKKLPLTNLYSERLNIIKPNSTVSFRALAEDEQHHIYASYYTGIAKKDDQKGVFTTLPFTDRIKGRFSSTYSLSYWNNHLLWNNTSIDLKTNKYQFLGVDEYGGHTTQCLHNDSLWFILWYTNKFFVHDLVRGVTNMYILDKRLGNNGRVEEISDMVADEEHNQLWLASKLDGICTISKKGKLLKKYSTSDLGLKEMAMPNFNDLLLQRHRLWYCSHEGLGYIDLKDGKSHNYPLKSINKSGTFENRVIFSMLPDAHNNFYLGTDLGLYYFNTTANKYYQLPDAHPLANIEFNRGAAFKSATGKYYMGGVGGLYSFTAPDLHFLEAAANTGAIKIYYTSIFNRRDATSRLLDTAINNMATLYLRPDDENISFHFSHPDFFNQTRYSYIIHGQSEQWTDFNKENSINIYKLSPGEYLLEIKAWNVLNHDISGTTKVTIIMPQIWYKRTWVRLLFLAALILSTILIVRGIYRYRLEQQHELTRLRTKISADLHDDVGTILAGISMQSQMLKYSLDKEQGKPVSEITSMSVDAMDRMRDIVWALDSRKDKYEDLIERMRAYAEQVLPAKQIAYKLKVLLVNKKMFINPEKRQAIYLIFKEALTNIVKHSDGDQVAILIKNDNNRILVMIHDNGSKCSVLDRSGSGISNMKMRAEKIGGKLNIDDKDGFKVCLSLDVK